VKPLSFGTLQPLKGKKFPGYDRIQEFTSRVLDKTFESLKDAIGQVKLPTITVDNIHFTEIDIKHLDEGKLSIKVEVTIPDVKVNNGQPISGTGNVTTEFATSVHLENGIVYDNNGTAIGYYSGQDVPVNGYANGTVTITLDAIDPITVKPQFWVNDEGGGNSFYIDYTDDINEVIDLIQEEFNGEIADIEAQLADLLESVRAFNQLSDQIDSAVNSYESDIRRLTNRYITKVYNKLNALIAGRAYRLFDPCMVATQDGKFALVSRTKRIPTKVSGSVTLFPTSYTLELFAPAYKKFIAVTHVYNADKSDAEGMKELIKKANGGYNMMKVIEGDQTVQFKGEAGKIYQISYAAVDYRGQMTRKKFYVQFK
jgi:hypothetical protein